ncbi:MAG TPA: 4Fe-4S dicluster domain-containing protein, partial [Saprospiraceae bacterium]|nr:4Fe-4S dicluster domain-containing protein [Saprospiraceae bacterium]
MSAGSNLNVTPFKGWIRSGSLFSGWISVLLLLGVALQVLPPAPIFLYASVLAAVLSVLLGAFPMYGNRLESIHHHGVWFSAWSARGWSAWLLGLFLTAFYVLLYWWPEYLGMHPQGNLGLVALFDPFSVFLKGQPASQWFVYGCLYTLVILIFGFKFILKHRRNRYQVLRTVSIMFFQTAFAFLIPEWLMRLNLPYNDFKNMWPLNYSFFDSWNLDSLISGGSIGWFMLVFGILMIVLISPVLTYLYGKRWYCSWVCGCGGLAETAGDSFRHLADRSLKAWKMERIVVYSILLLTILMTAGVLYTRFSGQGQIMGWSTEVLRKWYGFYIGGIFSGVIGVGFYPLLGSRVWCRFGCPMAAILGIQQRLFSRFRITVNGGQCISCGHCSASCEMGIDVRAYAQRGQDIVRASCVGCGICSAVCPRGVLKLENGS